jgi:asparagine synthase (glutamine-hydrolysing)
MCGLTGILAPEERAGLEDLEPMTRALDHRGPDDSGTWSVRFEAGGRRHALGFGHTRLSILDLSPLGHQPMATPDGSLVVTYNGEIYNFAAVRDDLVAKGHRFRSACDTEVLLSAWREWGPAALERLVGMFAFALWDARQRRLTLARDRLGIKPLYYRFADGVLTFGSELTALRRHRAFRGEVHRGALGRFLRSGYVSGRQSIYQDTFRVLPGETVTWEAGRLTRRAWWSLAEAAGAESAPSTFEGSVDALERTLGEAVECRLVSDVPLGAFLSGGIDSTAVVALMCERARGPVRTFSIGFEDRAFDEASHARAVARHLGTEHTELTVTRREALAVARELPVLYDEPFADASAIPTTLLSRLTREHVTVSLSGDGGDELFGGYGQYRKLRRLLPLHRLPPLARRLLVGAAPAVPSRELRNGLRHLVAPDSCSLAASLIAAFEPDELAAACGPEGEAVPDVYREAFEGAPSEEPVRRAMFADARCYLPDDILTKVDRASMSIALEARVPILDHRVVALAFAMPLAQVWHGGRTKAPLRSLVHRRVPPQLVERPKMGFGIPIESLLDREIEDWTRRYLDPARLREEGILDPRGIDGLLAAARSGARARSWWFLICFERWFARVHRGERDA